MIVTIYCEAKTCQFHTGSGCGANYTTIDSEGKCLGFVI